MGAGWGAERLVTLSWGLCRLRFYPQSENLELGLLPTHTKYAFLFLGLETSINVLFSISTLLPAKFMISLYFIAEQLSIVNMHHNFLILSSVEGNSGCLYFFAMVNRAEFT